MRFLLDTHVLLWLLAGTRLSEDQLSILDDTRNSVHVSAATVWEIAIKLARRKLELPPDLHAWLPARIQESNLTPLPVTFAHAARVEALPFHHSDPFDRLLIAQAQIEDLTLVTSDAQIEAYDVKVVRIP